MTMFSQGCVNFVQYDGEKPHSRDFSINGLIWVNNDQDSGGSETVPVTTTDLSTDTITSIRDLEDWTRLWIYTKGLNQGIHDGSIKVGLKRKNVGGTTPGIKIVKACDADGGLEYLTTDLAALNQAGGVTATPVLQDANDNHKNIVPTSGTADFVFPTDTWADLSDSAPKTYFIFEGSAKGKGQLEVVFLKSDVI